MFTEQLTDRALYFGVFGERLETDIKRLINDIQNPPCLRGPRARPSLAFSTTSRQPTSH